MIPEIARGKVSSLGCIQQKAYDPFANPEFADFQEPGEIIADGLIALLTGQQYHLRFDEATWRMLLELRLKHLTQLAAHTRGGRFKALIRNAQARCLQITEDDCVQFINDWEHDRKLWTSALRGMT